MPELPEVEAVVRGLNRVLVKGDNVEMVRRARAFRKDLRFVIPPTLLKLLPGSACLSVQRRAKYILFNFASDEASFQMISHLGMTGSWRMENEVEWTKRLHDHFALEFMSNRTLVYNDPRRFGYLELAQRPGRSAEEKNARKRSVKNQSENELAFEAMPLGTVFPHPLLDGLGPEPLGEEFTSEYLFACSRKRQVAIKVLIMNQKIVVGVGNIYASEALFRARIHPEKLAKQLSLQDSQRLVASIRHILELAIREGGSSIRDYKNVEGQRGGFQSLFQVYGRAGQPCVVCSTKIKQAVQGGRSTFWCPVCQAKNAGKVRRS